MRALIFYSNVTLGAHFFKSCPSVIFFGGRVPTLVILEPPIPQTKTVCKKMTFWGSTDYALKSEDKILIIYVLGSKIIYGKYAHWCIIMWPLDGTVHYFRK